MGLSCEEGPITEDLVYLELRPFSEPRITNPNAKVKREP